MGDAAVLTCMSYVDLNPIRAGMTDSVETSDFTSIQQRINQWRKESEPNKNKEVNNEINSFKGYLPVMPLVKSSEDKHIHSIGYLEKDYLELVDWAGRSVRNGKRGYINRPKCFRMI